MSNDLITEARELCEKATPGPWGYDGMHNEVHCHEDYFLIVSELRESPHEELLDEFGHTYNPNFALIARSRTIIPELCDALEKAQEQNKQLMHEVCKLACGSVGREKTLAKLEAEVAAAVGEGCDYCLSTWPERAADGFSDIWHGNKLSVGYGVFREISYCPMCGKRLEDKT